MLIEWVEGERVHRFLEWSLLLKSGGRQTGGSRRVLVWEQKGFCKDGQGWNVFIVDKGSSRGGEVKGLERWGRVACGTRSFIRQDGKDFGRMQRDWLQILKDSLSIKPRRYKDGIIMESMWVGEVQC